MSTKSTTILLSFALILVGQTNSQENAQYRVPRSLEECYREPYLLQRENRLPMTITTLIDLIRKVEESPGFNQDMRQLAISLVHRFRHDGIIKAKGVTTSESVLAYSPAGFQFSKHRLLLTRLIPGNAFNFPNETLSEIERCTLHSMLSSSIDLEVRGDEGQRCSQLAQYRSMRVPRSIKENKTDSHNFIGDVEFLQKTRGKSKVQSSGKLLQKKNPNEIDDEDYDTLNDYEDEPQIIKTDLVDIASDAISSCPVENGVIRTQWGAVSGGALITGIAAGLQPQRVQLRQLLALSPRRSSGVRKSGQQTEISVDNIWAATLAGDLAETALIQVPIREGNSEVGASGGWNSTVLPKWYFLTQRENLEITDAEIRGGLDGLIIASKITEWRGKASNMKLSQLLDMYYSQKGVLDSGIRACDRKKFFTEIAPIEEIKKQTTAFALVLDREMQLKVTLKEEAIKKFSEKVAEKLSQYIPSSLNDLSCDSTAPNPSDPVEVDIATDLYIYLDTTWPYDDISKILGFVISNININKHGSRVTLLNAMDGKVIVNTTESASDIFRGWNLTTQQPHPMGLNLPNVLQTMQNITWNLMLGEKANSSVGGRSLITLIVPYTATVNEGDSNFAADRIWRMREEVPDLKILFLSGGSITRFERFVRDVKTDLYAARQGDQPELSGKPVVNRIRSIPRRIINHRCGPNWEASDWGTSTMKQCVSPGSVNYYSILPNYFFQQGDNRKLRIQGQHGSSTINVCTSRTSELPRGNTTNKPEDLNCRQVTSNSFDIDLANVCEGHYVISTCPPFYISVEASKQVGTGSITSDSECRMPDQVRFGIQTEYLSCFSGVEKLITSSFVLLASVFTYFLL